MHNADLCDTLGNLVHRATNLCKKYCAGSVPDVPPPGRSPADLERLVGDYVAKMENFELEGGAAIAMQGFREVNRFLTEEAPWLKKGEEFEQERKVTVRATLEAVYVLAHLLLPFTPIGASAIFRKLNTNPATLNTLKLSDRHLEVGTKLDVGDVLYSKVSFGLETVWDDGMLIASCSSELNPRAGPPTRARRKGKLMRKHSGGKRRKRPCSKQRATLATLRR